MQPLFVLLGLIVLTGLSGCTQAVDFAPNFANPAQNQPAYRANLIIFYDVAVGELPLLEAVNAYGAELLYHYTQLNGIAIHLPAGKEMPAAIRYFEQVKGVLAVNQDSNNQLH